MKHIIALGGSLLLLASCLSSNDPHPDVTKALEPGGIEMIVGLNEASGGVFNLIGRAKLDPKGSEGQGIEGVFLSRFVQENGYNLHRYQIAQLEPGRRFDEALARAVLDEIGKWKRRNDYKKIILGGSAYGGWIALQAAAMDTEGIIDTVILASVNKFGPAITVDGKKNRSFDRTLNETGKLANRIVHASVLTACFNDDPWEVAGRCDQYSEIFTRNGIVHATLDSPRWAKGHFAFSHAYLANNYYDCLSEFLSQGGAGSCELELSKQKNLINHDQYDRGEVDREKFAQTAIVLEGRAREIFHGSYQSIPLIRRGTYNYKFFAYSPSTGSFGMYPYHYRNYAFREAMKLCGQPDCVIYAEGNKVVAAD